MYRNYRYELEVMDEAMDRIKNYGYKIERIK
jgi:hypothetical protein